MFFWAELIWIVNFCVGDIFVFFADIMRSFKINDNFTFGVLPLSHTPEQNTEGEIIINLKTPDNVCEEHNNVTHAENGN